MAAREIVEAIGLQIAPVHLAQRRSFQRGTDEGRTAQEIEPEGKAVAGDRRLVEMDRQSNQLVTTTSR